jgi:hypothetical protein
MKRYDKHIIVILTATCLLLISLKLAAQQKIQVASKTYSFEYNATTTLIKLYAEKSEIILNPSADNICRVEIKLISKNTDQQEAIRDLKSVKYSVEEKSGIVNLKNYFDPPEVRPVKSNLSVRYTIYVPVSKRIEINCLYSQITAQSVNINGSIDAAFSDVTLNKCDGRILLKTYYSGLKIDRGSAILSGSLDKSDMTLVNYSGPVDLTTHYGIISIGQEQTYADWKFNGSYTEFSLAINTSLLQNCKLTALSGSIDATAQYQKVIVKEKNKTTLHLMNNPSFPTINISTTFNTIHLYETKE